MSILVIAPHEDDETIMCAGTLRRAAQGGEAAHVCFMTNGEYTSDDDAAIRMKESLAALAALGLPESASIFLGYADTGMPYTESFLYRLYHEETIPSRAGHTETWLPLGKQEYRMQKSGTHSPYTRASVLRDLQDIIEELLPSEILMPAACDLHGDHAAASEFTQEALRAVQKAHAGYAPALLEYLVHTPMEAVWPSRTETFFSPPPQEFAPPWNTSEVRPLPAGFTARDKYELLSLYKSQHPLAYDGFLLAFAKADELLYRLPVKQGE